jgi:hypothetical protein
MAKTVVERVMVDNLKRLVGAVRQEDGLSAVLERGFVMQRGQIIELEEGSEMKTRREDLLVAVRARTKERVRVVCRLSKQVEYLG